MRIQVAAAQLQNRLQPHLAAKEEQVNNQGVKQIVQIVGLLVLPSMNLEAARDSRPADVTVYVNGVNGVDGSPPGRVETGAKAVVTAMYARIGIGIVWRDGQVKIGTSAGSPVRIQVRFVSAGPTTASGQALAFTLPFANGVPMVTVIYSRIEMICGRSANPEIVLARVLAHEIAHVLQRSNQHSNTGIMKANWAPQDEAMHGNPLDFTPADAEMIVEGLAALKLRAADERSRP